MPKISITEALVELKRLGDRITKAQNAPFTSVSENSRPPVGHKSNEEATTSFAANMQSAKDLLDRFMKIKSAISDANNTTKVIIDGSEYTITQALVRKNNLHLEKVFLQSMLNQYNGAVRTAEAKSHELDKKLEGFINTSLGSDAKNKADEVAALTKTFRENNKVEVVNGDALLKSIQELENSISKFEADVDTQLSIANATNYIELD